MASILYLGTEKGVVSLKSDDGRSWKIEDHTLDEWSIPKIAVNPASPNQVFAGTRGDGVWVSEDFGKKWKKPCYGKPGPGKVRCVTVDPKDSRLLYAGGEPIDLYLSDNQGKSWTRVDSVRKVPWVETVDYPVPTVEPHMRDIAVDPKDPKKIYAALQVGYILKSTDGGSTWKVLNRDLDCDVHTIVIHPQNTDTIYIATGGHDCRLGRTKGRALYVSRDAGENWAPMAAEFSQEYSVPLAMHPKDPDVLFSTLAHGQPSQWRRATGAESVVVRSKDGGKSWHKLNGQLSDTSRQFAEAIVIDEANPDRIYAALRTGELYGSQDGGDSWSRLNVTSPAAVSDMKCVSA
jgi:photosystem II stability/assembly factor-like uncharacterized protein